ncbi:CLAVATA3/ESR (CLE)-related protein 25-like [Magnolia sinica]|uniref:CLAVATA3/ESR (CLE)-related protein 25-like n=1 Tax=Magnolia sinica TaxID=86752 RepID=UPI00265956DF|nr:CLAVATA3/ESR (CLE)-related protein 25-like [Magnolia sinica]
MGSGPLKALVGVIACVMFLGFLFVDVDIVANGGTTTTTTAAMTTTTATTSSTAIITTGSFKQSEVMGRDGPTFHHDLDLNYMSKRRVPNGPDPIHNRRAGNSRRPPGRV